MTREDILLICSPETKFQETEFIRKDALLDWIKRKTFFEQGFEDIKVDYGYKLALADLINYLNKMEEQP